ncbi:MAG: hypothetical protein JRJ87_22325 [Deltaproteobacteria bacterium]|nr:hypothetical protein [Deltaproteobacteria bacterium]
MASKLDKAQNEYEKLLRDLGEKAKMVDMFSAVSPALIDVYSKAEESLSDRRLELEFIETELEDFQKSAADRIEELKLEIEKNKNAIKRHQKTLTVKKSKVTPLKKKLAGGEYDFKFAEKALNDEINKQKNFEEKEDFDRAKIHIENIKRMKIEILKRKKDLDDWRREIRSYDKPVKQLNKDKGEAEERLTDFEDELADLEESGGAEMIEELKRQKISKQKDVKRVELHLMNSIADIGEDLFDKRVKHPVLSKFYSEVDTLAKTIDELQERKK